jgi:hypothetical protein
MSTGPTRLILIRSGLFEFAEVELSGTLQIVGPNNTGKTTLINTLQFLYLNDRRHMDFGSYTPDQTRAFYFPSQYSYVLFECLGATGHCVLGWRGQSKTSGGEPERFAHLGPFDPADFLDEQSQVREPRDVNARLALKQFRLLKSAEEHKELLLPPIGTEPRGLGIVALRDPDKYHQFRETLKNLLTLSAITQDQMRDRLLMLADIPPQRTAFDARQLFGDDYDRIRARREKLITFKANQQLVETLVTRFHEREGLRGALLWRWTDLRAKRQQFEQDHESSLQRLRAQIAQETERARQAEEELVDRRNDIAAFSEQKGILTGKLTELGLLEKEFSGFVEEMERTALTLIQREIGALERQLADAQRESRDKVKSKLDLYRDLVRRTEQTVARFDHLAVTALRRHFADSDLNTLFRVLNRDLLELPIGSQSTAIARESELLATLRGLLDRVRDGVYTDSNISFPLPGGIEPVAGLANLETVREQLAEHRDTLHRWQLILTAIEEREKLEADLRQHRAQFDAKSRAIHRFEDYRNARAEEPRLRTELKRITGIIEAAADRVAKLTAQVKAAETARHQAEAAVTIEENAFNAVMGRFNQCLFPEFSAKPRPVDTIPNDFDAAIGLFLRDQEKQGAWSDQIARHLAETERWFGEEFHGQTEHETVALLQDELEALPEREDALARDWNAHLHGLKATFDLVLKNMHHVASAADDLNRALARVRISNLKAIKLQVIGQSDLLSWIQRLAAFEPGGLFDRDPEQESAITNFRRKLEANPVIRFADLFTLGVAVTGADDRRHTYHDFRQIESHGTTITIKVLFNLLLLKSQLRRDDCAVPFFLDEIQTLDPANRQAILTTARQLGFIAITAAPEAVSEVDSLYFLQPRKGRIILRNRHRVGIKHTSPNPP